MKLSYGGVGLLERTVLDDTVVRSYNQVSLSAEIKKSSSSKNFGWDTLYVICTLLAVAGSKCNYQVK